MGLKEQKLVQLSCEDPKVYGRIHNGFSVCTNNLIIPESEVSLWTLYSDESIAFEELAKKGGK